MVFVDHEKMFVITEIFKRRSLKCVRSFPIPFRNLVTFLRLRCLIWLKLTSRV